MGWQAEALRVSAAPAVAGASSHTIRAQLPSRSRCTLVQLPPPAFLPCPPCA